MVKLAATSNLFLIRFERGDEYQPDREGIQRLTGLLMNNKSSSDGDDTANILLTAQELKGMLLNSILGATPTAVS
jgi:hypothetical protein